MIHIDNLPFPADVARLDEVAEIWAAANFPTFGYLSPHYVTREYTDGQAYNDEPNGRIVYTMWFVNELRTPSDIDGGWEGKLLGSVEWINDEPKDQGWVVHDCEQDDVYDYGQTDYEF